MPKRSVLCIVSLIFSIFINAQNISVANERMNIFYAGIDNPISFAATGISIKSLVIKASNGTIKKEYGYYTFHSDSIGPTDVILYSKTSGKLKEVGRNRFGVKKIPPPIFKIGSGKHIVSSQEIASQQFVRAELENFDIDINFPVEQFTVRILSKDSCVSPIFVNIGNKISDKIRQAFKLSKNNDVIVFYNIFVTSPIEKHVKLESIIMSIKE
ncbi:MAG: GldM family protein [Ferruginibacter sp.]